MVTARPVAVEDAERRPATLVLAIVGAHVLHRQAHGGERDRIDADADRRLLGAIDGDLGHALDLGQALGDDGVGVVVELARRHRVRGQRQDHDRDGVRIGLAERRPRRQVVRQVGQRRIDRGLHVARGAVDVAVEIELERDAGVAERAARRHLDHAREFRRAGARAAPRPSPPWSPGRCRAGWRSPRWSGSRRSACWRPAGTR